MISFIVCSNGYGHLKRVLLVISELFRQNPGISINLFCGEPHLEFAKKEINFNSSSSINYYSDVSGNEINWISPGGITENRYDNWNKGIALNKVLQQSQLVISDNHVAPVKAFANAILMGSFLWHDVTVAQNQDEENVIRKEKEILAAKRPEMICVGAVVMDAVKTQTRPVPMPWMSNKYAGRFSFIRERSVLITGGGTELTNKLLSEICVSLHELDSNVHIYVDHKIEKILPADLERVSRFSFTDEAFSKLTLVVCRPGIGILTDCVRYGLPSVVINDGYNSEIRHNARCVSDMGIGISIDAGTFFNRDIAQHISNLLSDKEHLQECINRLEVQTAGGAAQTAAFILNKLKLHELATKNFL
jgi:hypothetical protein